MIHDQNILDEQIKLIQASDHFIVTDLFLYNDYYNTTKLTFPKSTLKLTNALISQKKKHPQMPIYLITDEINNFERKIQVRWYDTHGEQYHSKIIGIESAGNMAIIGGSANYTRRNLDNYNLEETILVVIDQDDPVANDFRTYFDRIWNNTDGIYTTDFSTYKDTALWKVLVYQLQEATGLCTF